MPEPNADAGFYVGYLPVPGGLRRFLAWAAPIAAVGIVAAGFMLAGSQRDPGPATWSDREVVRVTGTLLERPYPMLVYTDRGGPVLLVQSGKHGAAERAAGMDGTLVRATGTLLMRDGGALLELGPDDGDLRQVAGPPAAIAAATFGERVTLRGEIVDSKCYHGAMKPGEGKPHKECATLCIRGGIPPMFVSRGEGGGVRLYLLADEDGGPMDASLVDYIADPIELSGSVLRIGDQVTILHAQASSVRRR